MKSNSLQKSHTNAHADLSRLTAQLRDAVENELLRAESKDSIRSISERVILENSAVVEALTNEFIVGQVSRLVVIVKAEHAAAERAKLRAQQIPLPGFEHLPLRVRFREGGKLLDVTSGTHRQLRDYIARLRKRQSESPQIAEAKALMDLITKWKKKLKTKRQITAAEAMEYEAGIRIPEVKKAGKKAG